MYFYLVEDDELPLSFLKNDSINIAYARGVFIHNGTDILIRYLEEIKRVLVTGGVFYTQYCADIPFPELVPWLLISDREKINNKIKELDFEVITNREYLFSRWDDKGEIGHQDIKGQAIILQK